MAFRCSKLGLILRNGDAPGRHADRHRLHHFQFRHVDNRHVVAVAVGGEQQFLVRRQMRPMEYRLKVGQGYRWKIIASDLTEYAFVAPEFIRNIWIRKVEVGEVEIKAVTLDELEFENGGEAELFFVAIRPGTYEFGSRGLMDRGVVGNIIVEADES